MPKTNARANALTILLMVLRQKKSLDAAFVQVLRLKTTETPTKAIRLTKQLCYGCVRHYFSLETIINQQLSKKLKPKDFDVLLILIVGAYQLQYLRQPAHAVVNETVQLTQVIKKSWARGVVNGILRKLIRQPELLVIAPEQHHFEHPEWLFTAIQSAYPDQYQAVLTANNQRAPMHLRVNQRQTSRDEYLQRLIAQGIEPLSPFAESTTEQVHTIFTQMKGALDNAITLTKPCDVYALPGFDQGRVSVQDLAAQVVCSLLTLKDELTILDACAAPGGKTAHILESCTPKQLIALDHDAERLKRVEETLQRLQLSHLPVSCKAAKAEALSTWWDGNTRFDRILLDAPCSGTGVIRRHPDIKHLRRAADIEPLVSVQSKLLAQLWQILKPGGILVYATCSILPQENCNQVAAFLAQTPDAQCTYQQQLLPDIAGHDGFFYAQLIKQ